MAHLVNMEREGDVTGLIDRSSDGDMLVMVPVDVCLTKSNHAGVNRVFSTSILLRCLYRLQRACENPVVKQI